MSARLIVDGLVKSFGERNVLAGTSFVAEAGERWLLTGPSGSGKSTLLRIIAGLDTPDEGRILMRDEVASEPSAIRIPPNSRRIGMLFQDLGLWPHLTAGETLDLVLRARSVSQEDRKQRVADALARVGLQGSARKKPGTMSVGEQQRLALARALVIRPAIMLLDEPFSSADLKTRIALCELVVADSRDRGTTVVLAGHDLSDSLRMDAKLAILESGSIRQSGVLHDILAEPKCDTAALWASLRERGHEFPPPTTS